MLREGGMFIMHELTCPSRLADAFFWNIHFKLLQAYGKWKDPEEKTLGAKQCIPSSEIATVPWVAFSAVLIAGRFG
jgi:hypothetical protein